MGRAAGTRRGRCPSADEFATFFSREIQEHASERFLDHALCCRSCGHEFKVLSRLSTRIEPLLAPLDEAELTPQEGEQMRRAALAKLRSLRRDGSPFIWFRSPLGRMASLAALVLILALGGIILLRRPGPEPVEQDIFRSGGELSLDLESPRGETVFEDLVFVWRSYRHAETYGFELLNPDLALLWSDGVKRRTRLELPPGVRQLLRPGAYYFWKVKAFDSNGRELASGLQSFRLK